MSTNTNIQNLYTDIVADLAVYFENSVLLPNPSLIGTIRSIAGGAGDTVRIPVQTAWTAAGSVTEGNSILANASPFQTSAITVQATKKGAGTSITEEALEDGGMDMVRTQVINQLSGALAQATDVAGFTAMTAGATGYVNAGVAGAYGLVWSPMGVAYVSKREPTVKMFNNVDTDSHDVVATVRNGFGVTRGEFLAKVRADVMSLSEISTAVAALRGNNAPTDASGFYMAAIDPTMELALAGELNGVGAGYSGAVGDLSMIGNQALLTGLIGQAVGVRFFRSNNLV